ncbi:MAG: orotate phosphoribosyltransferase [Pirellulales bacterium]|nr:orotate phosphoribosyltransferase [Pirellulales bacterium]
MYDSQQLLDLIHAKALKLGDFTLASGKKANFYLDLKQITLDAAGARLVAEGMLELLGESLPAAVGGLAIGADPITAAIVTLAGVRGLPLVGFMVRKEAKGHGTNKFVEGPVQPGNSAVIVEDVITTGGSAMAALERARDFGLKVDRVLAIVDRLEGGADAFAVHGAKLSTLLTIRDLNIPR